jgi:hypothetical protein
MPKGVPNVVLGMHDYVGFVNDLRKDDDGLILKYALEKVAAEHSLSLATLKTAFYRAQKAEDNPRDHGSRVLTKLEEGGLLAAAIAFSSNNQPLGIRALRIAAAGILKTPPSRGVLRGFLKRHKKILKRRTSKALTKERNDRALVDEFELYAESLRALKEQVPFNADLSITADEVSIFASTNGTIEFVAAGDRAQKGAVAVSFLQPSFRMLIASSIPLLPPASPPAPPPPPPAVYRDDSHESIRIRRCLFLQGPRVCDRLHAPVG